MFRRALATTLVFLLAGMPLLGQSVPLGVVTQSSLGHLNSAVASVGTTIYNGDRLSTEAAGALGVRSGSAQLLLSGDSAIFVGQEGRNLTAAIQRGSVVFTVESDGALLLTAADVRVRPQSSALTVGQITLEDCAVVVTSRVQTLEVTAGKESKIVEAGQSYRVSLDTGCGRHPSQPPVAAAYSRFLLIPIIIVGGITIPAIREAFESPDRP
jgi:ferric-dicitrate binding protein FerR (iron transport regulator)